MHTADHARPPVNMAALPQRTALQQEAISAVDKRRASVAFRYVFRGAQRSVSVSPHGRILTGREAPAAARPIPHSGWVPTE